MKYAVKDGELWVTGEWPTTQDDALAASIQKWACLARWMEHHPRGGVPDDGGSDTCACCHLTDDYDDQCTGCPIADAGYPMCKNTPYMAYYSAPNGRAGLKAARAELAFLKSLKVPRRAKR